MTTSAAQHRSPSEGSYLRPTLSVAEAADLLGVSQWLVLQQVARGNLPHRRFGRRILIPRARFLDWLDGQAASDDHP